MQVDRQGADLQRFRQVLGFEIPGEPARDLGAGAAVDPVGVFLEVDDRPRFDFVVEDDREVARERFDLFLTGQADRLFLAALGDLAGDFVEGVAARVGEFEDDDRFAEFAGFLFRVGDFFAAQRRFVDQRVPAGFGAFDRRPFLLRAVRRRRPSRPGP